MSLFLVNPFLRKYLFTSLVSFLLFFIMGIPASARQVKVGVYNNMPLVFQDKQGLYQGLTIDILRYIAEQEGWELQFVQGTWSECLQRLAKGEIDLQVAIAVTDERKKKFSYPVQALITNWGRVYRHPGLAIDSFPNLVGKTVALLEKDIHSRVFLELMAKFDQQIEPLYLSSYDAVLEQVEKGTAAVGVVNRLYAMQNVHRFKVEATPMIFNPIQVSYAAPKGKRILLQAMDHHLQDLKLNQKSLYYQSFEKWFGDAQAAIIPAWVKAALFLAGSLLAVAFAVALLLRRQVARKTAELRNANQQLTNQINQLQITEEELRNSKKNLQESHDIAKMGRWVLDLVNNCLHWSKTIYEIFELDPKLFSAGYDVFLEAIHPEDREKAHQAYTDSLIHRQQYNIEHRLLMPDGRIKWVNEICKNEYDTDGKALRSIGVVRDITEMKNLERQLLQSQKMEAIGTLAGGVAHDFNNILSAIMGFSELAKDSIPSNNSAHKNLDIVIESSRRAADLVQQILTFSRKTAHQMQPMMPHLIVKEALEMLRVSLPATLSLKSKIDSDCGLIMADPTNIHQIVVNLCTNALHAMENKKGTLAVSLCRKNRPAQDINKNHVSSDSFVVLSVNDTGTGMDNKMIERIFEPYFTTKEIGRGTGLGLAVIHGIVKDYKGFIEVESELGKGTTFNVYFPALEKVVSIDEKIEEDFLGGGTERIMIVDDEEKILTLQEKMLEHLGYKVTATTNSSKLLKIIQLQPNQFDLLITDQNMPFLSGVELAKEVLQIRPDMPIILCTGYSSVITEERALALGIKKYVRKPVSRSILAKIVRQVLDGTEK